MSKTIDELLRIKLPDFDIIEQDEESWFEKKLEEMSENVVESEIENDEV